MLIYLARHGEAGRAANDDDRPLTASGIATTRLVYSQLADHIEEPLAVIVSSPLLRARQTAEIALELLPTSATELLICPELRPESTPEAIAQLLDAQLAWPVLLVGHQPIMGNLLSWLTGHLHFRHEGATSSLYALDLITPARGCGEVLWHS